jgi:hypothetical protein
MYPFLSKIQKSPHVFPSSVLSPLLLLHPLLFFLFIVFIPSYDVYVSLLQSTIYAFPASQSIPWPQVAFTQVIISVCLTFGPSLVSLRLKRRGYNYRIQEIQVKKESIKGWKGREKEWNENGTREGIRATGIEGDGL